MEDEGKVGRVIELELRVVHLKLGHPEEEPIVDTEQPVPELVV